MLPAAPRMRRKFEGLNQKTAGGHGFTWFPPDTIVAAGPNEVLEATNSALRLSSRANKDVEIQTLNDHFGVKSSRAEPRGSGSARLAGNLFDPKTYFDRLSNRFFVVALLQNDKPNESFIYLSVSRSSSVVSLENGWCNYRIRGKRSNSWADYPGLGMNGSWLAISANNFKFNNKGGTFHNVYLYVVDKVSLVDNASSCPKLKLFVFKAPKVPGDFWDYKADTVQPAQHYTESNLPGDPLFFVSTGISPDYVLWSITAGSSSAAVKRPTLSRILLQGDRYSTPPNAQQKGGGVLLDTADTRMMQVAFRDGDLWATHATACNVGAGPTESCISVLQITVPSAISGTVDFQQIYGRKNEFFWWPGIAVNKLGDIVVVFQRSSKKMFLSTAYTGKKARNKKMAMSEFPKWRKYLISLSFRGQSSVRPVQVGGFDVNIVIHRSTAVRGRGGPARHDAWPPSLGAILAHTDGPLWKLTAPWTHRTRPPRRGKRAAFSTSFHRAFPIKSPTQNPERPQNSVGKPG